MEGKYWLYHSKALPHFNLNQPKSTPVKLIMTRPLIRILIKMKNQISEEILNVIEDSLIF